MDFSLMPDSVNDHADCDDRNNRNDSPCPLFHAPVSFLFMRSLMLCLVNNRTDNGCHCCFYCFLFHSHFLPFLFFYWFSFSRRLSSCLSFYPSFLPLLLPCGFHGLSPPLRWKHRLTRLGRKNKKGKVKWTDSGVRGVINNEKYKGDLLLGKSFTVDPISKRRLENMGEEEQYYIKEHHEPIVRLKFGMRHRRLKKPLP